MLRLYNNNALIIENKIKRATKKKINFALGRFSMQP